MAKEYKNITKWHFWVLSLSISLSLAWSWLICLLITLITCLKARFALLKILNLFSSASQFLDLKLIKPIQIYFSRLNHINPLSSCLSPQCQSPRAEPLHMWGRRVSRSSWPCTSRTLRPPWTGCSSHGKRWVAVDGLRGRRGLDRRYATDAGPLRFLGDQHLSRWLGCQILLAGDFLIFGLGGRSQWNFWSVLAPMQSWWSCWCRWGGQCPKKEKKHPQLFCCEKDSNLASRPSAVSLKANSLNPPQPGSLQPDRLCLNPHPATPQWPAMSANVIIVAICVEMHICTKPTRSPGGAWARLRTLPLLKIATIKCFHWVRLFLSRDVLTWAALLWDFWHTFTA